MPNVIPYLQGRLAKLQRFQRNLPTIQNLHVLEIHRGFQSIYKLNVLELPRIFRNWAKLALLALYWLSSPKLSANGLANWAVRNIMPYSHHHSSFRVLYPALFPELRTAAENRNFPAPVTQLRKPITICILRRFQHKTYQWKAQDVQFHDM